MVDQLQVAAVRNQHLCDGEVTFLACQMERRFAIIVSGVEHFPDTLIFIKKFGLSRFVVRDKLAGRHTRLKKKNNLHSCKEFSPRQIKIYAQSLYIL